MQMKSGMRALKKAKNRAGVNVLDFKGGYGKGVLTRNSCNNTFGVPDMYDAQIEIALGGLEQRVSKVIEVIENDFFGGKQVTVVARPQKDLLRKFIFIMAYRNRKIHERFGGEEDDYDSNDRAELLAYMHDKGIKALKEVWLNNIRAFIDVDLGQEPDCWLGWLMNNAYPSDARWFWKNMTTSYLCFCTPKDTDEEFVLTQNAYCIFEGPCSHQAWTDWHNFAPVNHRLVIVSRNQCFGGIPNLPANLDMELTKMQHTAIEAMTSIYEDPAKAHSWLEDLPVSRPVPSCWRPRRSSNGRPLPYRFAPEDTFTFKFFALPSTFLQRMNAHFLEEAIMTDTIVYKSPMALRKALESYVEMEKPGLKIAVDNPREKGPEIWCVDYTGVKRIGDGPEYNRQAYLNMLERIARSLGSDCTANVILSTPKTCLIVPPLPPTFVTRYKKLGFNDTIKSWLDDEEQAHSISYFWVLTNDIARTGSKQIRLAMQQERLRLVWTLHARRVWLHLRLMRVLTDRPPGIWTASRDDFLHRLVAEDNGGPEDVNVDCMSMFYPQRVSRAMMRASGMRQYYELCTERGHSPSKAERFDAAMAYVGTIADCDLVRVKEAAVEIGLERNALAVMAVAARSGRDETIARELWMRDRVYRDFKSIVGGIALHEEEIQELKKLLFQLLYTLPLKD